MNDLVTFITDAAPSVILVLSLNGLGLALKRMPFIADWVIPLALPVVGSIIYPFVGEYSPGVLKAQFPKLLMSLYGFGLGWVAVGANQFWRQTFGHFWNGKDPTPPQPSTVLYPPAAPAPPPPPPTPPPSNDPTD
jgi:hypothetical protein